MFYLNKYTTWYFNIINSARTRNPDFSGELHHIIPKCLNGGDESNNLVKLTYREHYIVHALLTKMHSSPKLITAFWGMSFMNETKYYNSRLYEYSKRLYVEKISGNNHWMKTEENKRKLSDSWDEDRKKIFHSKVSGDNHWTRKIDMNEHARKMRQSLTKEMLVSNGKKGTFATNNPMKNPDFAKQYKKPKERVTCPHCNKIGGKPVMMRYHFEKCKEKKS
jgi:hypothetical protein